MPIVAYTDSNQDATLYGLARKMAYAMETGAAPMKTAIQTSSGRILFQKLGDVVRALVTVIYPEIIVGAVHYKYSPTSPSFVYRAYTWGEKDSDTGYLESFYGIAYGISRDGIKILRGGYGFHRIFDRKTREEVSFPPIAELPEKYLQIPDGFPSDGTDIDPYISDISSLYVTPENLSGDGRSTCGWAIYPGAGITGFMFRFYKMAVTSSINGGEAKTNVLEIPEYVELPSGTVLRQMGFWLDSRIRAYFLRNFPDNEDFKWALLNFGWGKYSAGSSEALAISEDGRTICGYARFGSEEWNTYVYTLTDNVSNSLIPCVWRDGVFEVLDPGPPFISSAADTWLSNLTQVSTETVFTAIQARATHMSKDGRLIVGYRKSPVASSVSPYIFNIVQICIWRAKELSTFVFPNGSSGRPTGMSDDGSVIVGNFEDYDGGAMNPGGGYLPYVGSSYAVQRYAWVLRRGEDGEYTMGILKGSEARPQAFLVVSGCSRSGRVIIGYDRTIYGFVGVGTIPCVWRDGVFADLPIPELVSLQSEIEGPTGFGPTEIN